MAIHVACRFALIAFATVAIRGLVDGIDFEAAIMGALTISLIVGLAGLIVGELARRLIEDVVAEVLTKTLHEFAQHLGVTDYQFRIRDVAAESAKTQPAA